MDNNQQWLTQYWSHPNSVEMQLLQYIKGMDFTDAIQPIYDRFRDSSAYLSVKEIARLRESLQGLPFPEAKALQQKRRVSMREAMVCLIIAALLALFAKITKRAQVLFGIVATNKYQDITSQAEQQDVAYIMGLPMASGRSFELELINHARYRANQLTNFYVMQRAMGIVSASEPQAIDILEAELNSLLRRTRRGHTGLLDEMMTNIVGYTTLRALRDRGVRRVEFVAEIDRFTTSRCRELNGTILHIDQLLLGYNVPPISIDSVPHPCRSALRIIS